MSDELDRVKSTPCDDGYSGKLAGDFPCRECGWLRSLHPCRACGEVKIPFWIRADADTALAAFNGDWPKADYPHEQDAVEKIRGILEWLTK